MIMTMKGKVLASSKVVTKYSDGLVGTLPRSTAPNPSQANGSNPPTLRPPAMSGHLSPKVRADLAKLEPSQRAEILRVANSK
jgi:hypothetical protein